MLDPLVYRNGGFGGVGGAGVGVVPGGAMRLAAEETQAPEIALAYAKVLKEPPAPPAVKYDPFARRRRKLVHHAARPDLL